MFFNRLSSLSNSNQLFYLNSNWCINLPGLVRVPFFDPNEKAYGYVVYYSEIKQEYGIVKFSKSNGDVIWIKTVCNGGYGTPVVFGNMLVCHKEFNSIVALDKNTGAEIWHIKTSGRIRTSISHYGDSCYFASVGVVYKIDKNGEFVAFSTYNYSDVFYYGNIVRYEDYILLLGVEFNHVEKKSILYLYYFDTDLSFIDKIKLNSGSVISSDTSGLWITGRFAIITCNSEIYKIDIPYRSIVFVKQLEGIACRHIPISDGNSVFYTTLNGYVSSINVDNGNLRWSKHMEEDSIVAPPSLMGKSLFILADGKINVLDKDTGSIIQSKVIGHSPYSAAILVDDRIYIGCGEPPSYGNLICLNLVTESECYPDPFKIRVYNKDVAYREKTLIINTDLNCSDVEIFPSAIAIEEEVKAQRISDNLFQATISLKSNCIKGYYGIPIKLNVYNTRAYYSLFRLELQSLKPLPSKVLLKEFAIPVRQEDHLYSGAALVQLLMKIYGKEISQKKFREIIDFVKEKSCWKDADFQTWRLILKRVISSPYNDLSDFIRNEF